jgi:tetratricopeptide (TPR) repeat protein
MSKFDQEDIEEQKTHATKLISQAEDFLYNGKVLAGLKAYNKAMNIYFNIGSYGKLPDIFYRISQVLSNESKIYQALEYLRQIKDRLHKLDLPEEEAKLSEAMAKLLFRVGDYYKAADYYEECAELYLKADPDFYRSLSSIFLMSAAECYEYAGKHEVGERIVILAVLRLNPKPVDFRAEEYRGIKFLGLGMYKEAIEVYTTLMNFFSEGLSSLSDLLGDLQASKINITSIYSKTRLVHIISEYRLILMHIHYLLDKKKEAVVFAEDSIDHLFTSIIMIKSMISAKIWTREDIKRLTYEGFMAAYFQMFPGVGERYKEMDFESICAEGIEGDPLEVLKSMPYYNLIVKMKSYERNEIEELLKEFNLGRLEKYKDLLMGSV